MRTLRLLPLTLVSVPLLLACNLLNSAAPPTAAEQEAADHNARVAEEHAAKAKGAGEFTLTADLDGDGKADRIVVGDTKIRIGSAELAHDLFPISDEQQGCAYQFEEGEWGFEARITDIDRNDKSKELSIACCVPDGEDLCGESFFTLTGGKIVASKEIATGGGGLPIAGNGKIVRKTVDYEKSAEVEETYVLKGGKVELANSKVLRKMSSDEFAACPFVYVAGPRGFERTGEILRQLKRPELEALQSLPLPAHALRNGKVVVRLAEKKPETTWLDSVYLSVGGQVISPNDCGDAAWCTTDRRHHRLEPGQSLELVFDVGSVPAGTALELWASGYYVPHTR